MPDQTTDPAGPTRVVVVDDQDLVLAGFTALISAEPGMTVVGRASRGDDALAVVARMRPHVLLLDVRMPGMDGIEVLRRLAGWSTPPATVVLTTFDLDEYVFGALRHGARGFLLKDAPPAELLDAVRRVAAGGTHLSAGVQDRVVEHFRSHRDARPLPSLSLREQDVLAQLCVGLSNQQIAHALGIGEATVKTFVGRLLDKFGAPSRVAVVVAAMEAGFRPDRPGRPAPSRPPA